jgi:trimeric autotransporter adhesin
MSYLRDGNNPLAYLGVQPSTPPQAIVLPRSPTPNDNHFNLLTLWLNNKSLDLYYLGKVPQGVADWIPISTGGIIGIETLTTEDSTVVSPIDGNINIIGGTGIDTTGDDGDATVTITATGTFDTPVTVPNGGTGDSSFLPYAVITGGITSTGPLQSVASVGTAGQVLTSNGAGELPSFQSISSSGGGSALGTGSTGGVTSINQTGQIVWTAPFGSTASTAQSNQQFIMPVAGTLSNLYVYVISNGSTTNTTITVNKNSAHSAIVATITALTTGEFSDTVHSISVSAGDLIQFEGSQSTTGEVAGVIGIEFSGGGGGGGGTSEFLSGNDSSTASPAAGVITFTGAGGNTVTASGSTVTITGSGSSNPATSFITSPSTGTATPASGVVTFAGTGTTTVSASGSTVTINSTGSGGSGITTINGNIGSMTGSTVKIATGTYASVGFGGTALFVNSGSTSVLSFTDNNGNTGVGSNSLASITSPAHGNTALGAGPGTAVTTGINNTLLGTLVASSLTTGNNNIVIGSVAYPSGTSGSNNIIIGAGNVAGAHSAGYNYTGGETNNICIASVGLTGESNALHIGDNPGSTGTVILSAVYIGGIALSVVTGVPVLVNGGNRLGVATSSRRFKNDIKDMGSSSNVVYNLRPVTFTWNKSSAEGMKYATDDIQYGLVAEEVNQVIPSIVNKDKNGDPFNINYTDLIPLLLNELQIQKNRIDELERLLNARR